MTRWLRCLFVGVVFGVTGVGYAADDALPVPASILVGDKLPISVFALVDGEPISSGAYQRRLFSEVRQSFYHGRIPDEEVAVFRRKVADQIVDEYILAREARARGLTVEESLLEERWLELDRRNQDNPEWPAARERIKELMYSDWEQELLSDLIIERVKDVSAPSDEQVEAYYLEHSGRFTEPASHRISMILLGVDPGAGEAAWVSAEEQARGLYDQLQAGADFAGLAEQYSTDYTADQGGDMGVVHAGMVGDEVQALIEALNPGEVGEPLRLLQGVALFKLVDRIEEKLHPLEAVYERAASLWRRDQAELAAEALIFELKQQSSIKLNELVVSLPDGE